VAYLLDTSLLARLANTADTQYASALNAIVELHRRREILHLTPQVLIEFRNVATRPKAQNGLGLSVAETIQKAESFEKLFPLLPETAATYPEWKAIVDGLGIVGKQVHDARLVAICRANAITHLLTFNIGHFARLVGTRQDIIVVDPKSI
jgi:predicted nucleic acid-binding protein